MTPARRQFRIRRPEGLVEVSTRTVDGVQLRGFHLGVNHPPLTSTDAVPGSDQADRTAFVICHGMTNATSQTSTFAVLAAFAEHRPVVAFDFRGHGRSSGRSTVGRDEVLDIDAAIAFARAAGYRRVVLIGFSMGAAIALRQAGGIRSDARLTHPADVVVSVSAPGRWFMRDTTSMRRVQWLLEHPAGRLIGPRMGIRLGQPWEEIPTTPLQEISSIAPTPLLLVHGTRDHYFAATEAVALHRAAPSSELWLIDGMAHGESGTSRQTIGRIVEWALNTGRLGRPVRGGSSQSIG